MNLINTLESKEQISFFGSYFTSNTLLEILSNHMIDDSTINCFSKFCLKHHTISNRIFILNPTFYTALIHNNIQYANNMVSDFSFGRKVSRLSKRYAYKKNFFQFTRLLVPMHIPCIDSNGDFVLSDGHWVLMDIDIEKYTMIKSGSCTYGLYTVFIEWKNGYLDITIILITHWKHLKEL